MEAVALRRSFENLGLQFLFSPVRSLAGSETSVDIPERKRRALEDLGRFFQEATSGLNLVAERRAGGYGSLGTLEESVKAERAYGAIAAVLPTDPTEAKELLGDLNVVRQRMLDGDPLEPKDRQALHTFCKKVLDHLDQERFTAFGGNQNVWP
ncbi:MAG: hypothetical protein ACLQPN_00850 [Bryobacteraceae bacterium]